MKLTPQLLHDHLGMRVLLASDPLPAWYGSLEQRIVLVEIMPNEEWVTWLQARRDGAWFSGDGHYYRGRFDLAVRDFYQRSEALR